MKSGIINTKYKASQVAVIPNSSDNNDFAYNQVEDKKFRSTRAWLGNKPLLIYAGTFGRVNGVAYAVELANFLQSLGSNIRILLVGDGAERGLIIKQAKDTGVYEKNLFIESQMSKRDVGALFSAASMASSLFIDLPEMRVNSANKFFDSLASGKPIFLNYGGWMHDLVNQHQCGISAWGRPIQEVAFELNQKMNDSVWLSEAGKSAKYLAENYFDRDVLANQLEQVLSAVKAGRSELASEIAPGIYK
jgi:glycosyltransferase involved in cell wall biosynthesis